MDNQRMRYNGGVIDPMRSPRHKSDFDPVDPEFMTEQERFQQEVLDGAARRMRDLTRKAFRGIRR